jgi:hypothetical protein
VGFFEKRRRKHEGQEVDWPLLATMMTFGYELDRAEKEGITDHDQQGERAASVRDQVVEVIGETILVEGFKEASQSLNDSDENPTVRALQISGYLEARAGLFPD